MVAALRDFLNIYSFSVNHLQGHLLTVYLATFKQPFLGKTQLNEKKSS